MKIINRQIYDLYQELTSAFLNEKRYFPAKVNYIIQKNLKTLYQLTQEIENIRLNIVEQYGEIKENYECVILPENISIATKELNDLSNIEQDINILYLQLKDIEDIEFTPAQMGAILFMIKDEGEE